jgi:hypothetical protein
MKKTIIHVMLVSLNLLIVSSTPALADDSSLAYDSKKDMVQSVLSAINVTGGISAGYFYASNPGEDTADDAFLLSNLLVEISSKEEALPVGFVGAFGEISTPSILATPENNTDFKIEYASVTLKPIEEMGLEIGLLQPNAGFENTYTFNNNNVMLGAVASQQPYNAYGARVNYDMGRVLQGETG